MPDSPSAHKAARDIVRKQKAAIEFLANVLLAQETLEGPELDAVLEQVRQKMVDLPVRRWRRQKDSTPQNSLSTIARILLERVARVRSGCP